MNNYDDEEYSPKSEIENTAQTAKDVKNTVDRFRTFSSQAGKQATNASQYSGASQSKASSNASSFSKSASQGKATASSGSATSTAATSASSATTASGVAASAGASTGASAGTAAATSTTAAAGAAAATGVGLPLAIILLVAGAISNTAKGASEEVTGDRDLGIGIAIIILFIIFILVGIILAPAIAVINVIMKPIHIVEGAWNTAVDSVETYISEEVKENYFEKYAIQLMDISDDEDLSYAITTQRELNEETIAVYKNIIDWSIYKAFSSYIYSYFTDLGTYRAFLFDGYSPIRTYQKFKNNPYPYRNRENSSSSYTTIDDFLDLDFQDIMDEINYNNDLNYAEIFSVICQNNAYNFENFSYSDFYDLMVSKETAMLLFEMSIAEDPNYYILNEGETVDTVSATASYVEATQEDLDNYLQENCPTVSEDITFLNDEYLNSADAESDSGFNLAETVWKGLRAVGGFFAGVAEKASDAFMVMLNWGETWCMHFFFDYDVSVMPYGLEELYQIAGINYNAYNTTFTSFRNYELLDMQEKWIRELLPGFPLGPSYEEQRTNKSPAYERIANMIGDRARVFSLYPSGRSPLSYMNNSYINMEVLGTEYLPAWCNRGHAYTSSLFNLEGDTKILNMYQYINQGEYKDKKRGYWNGVGTDTRKTIAYEGCIDCCYIMAAEYYNQTEYNVAAICQSYVNASRQFEYGRFCNDYDIISGSKMTSFNVSYVEGQLRQGHPVLLHIFGLWKTKDGIVLHSGNGGDNGTGSDHYMLITGFCDSGFFMMDPASYENTYNRIIPVDAFRYADQLFVKAILPTENSYIGFKTQE